VKRGGSLSFLVGTISNVLVMGIGWTDVGSGGYILVSYAHSNTSLHVACNYQYLGWVLTLMQGFWGEIYIYIRGLLSVQSGVLPVYYSDHAAIYSILQ
jgi:hypothetical protein